MGLKNTKDTYGSIAKTLHWFIALLFLAAYVSVYYRQWFTEVKTTENWTALQLHLSIGVSIGVFVLLRILWRLMNVTPKPSLGTKLEHLSAKIGHLMLYAVMIIMPLTGYTGTGVNTEFFFLFDIPKFADTSLFQWIAETYWITFEELEEPIDFVHKEIGGKWLVWILIVGHIIAALYHHFIKKDDTLRRMAS